jgi:TraM recognition site of TraD and TraG
VTFISRPYLAGVPADQQRAFFANHINLGYHPETKDDFYVHTIDRYSGMYISGMPGSGKSGLLENMILQDALTKAVIVLDPHMDLVERCLSALPTERLPHTYLLDMTDEQHPFGINIFSNTTFTSDMEKTQAVARIEHIFDKLWEDVLKQVGLPRFMRMATLVFLANPGTTLVDMYTFLLDDGYRRKLLQNVSDLSVRQFWQLQYDSLPPQSRINKVQPLLGRLEQLFAGRVLVRNIVGQRQNSIDFRKSIENKEIIFIKLPLKRIPEDARLIGTILVAQIHAALFSFVDIPEKQRPGVSLYIDEFQNFATDDIEELFTEGRKYGMRITVAHQFRAQLSKEMREATMNALTKIVFQSTPEDGRELAQLFPAPNEGVRPENVDPHPTETLANHVNLYPPEVQDFIEWYILPVGLQAVGAHGNMIELRDLGVGAMDLALGMMSDGMLHEVKIENPLVYLDYLLQMVMVYGDASLPIPALAVRGFANCGHSFWQQVRDIRDDDKRLLADIPALNIPKHLAAQTPDGWAWTRNPESGKEQLLHFLFHVRLVMRYLAAHPLGKETVASATEVGKMLNQLPRRCAWVRSGTQVGTIFTHDTPKGTVPAHGITFVRDHTRQVYCRPKAEVEKQFTGNAQPAPQPATQFKAPAPVEPPPVSGWEEAE